MNPDTEKIDQIINHFGPIHQFSKLVEEVHELIISFYSEDYENITEECADVFIMLYQFYLYDKAMQKQVEFKIDRTIERIKKNGNNINI